MSGAPTAALERRIKRHVLGTPHTAIIRFPKGFGDVCVEEVTAALGAMKLKQGMTPEVTLETNGVALQGIGFVDLVALALELTTAREILWTVAEGRADTAKAFRAKLESAEWDLLLPTGSTVGLRVEATASRLYHESRLGEDITKALAAHGISTMGAKDAQQLLDVRLKNDHVRFSLSIGGRPLYQRHYKTQLAGTASVKEDIAAAATRLSLAFARARRGAAWRPSEIVVPFAGSGTLGFEAALQLGAIPPSLFFGALAADSFVCSPEASLRFARRRLVERMRAAPAVAPVRFLEIDADASEHLRHNVAAFNEALSTKEGKTVPFEVTEGDVLELLPKLRFTSDSFVAINPPYGDRVKSAAASPKAHQRMGDRLAAAGAAGYALLPTPEAVQAFTKAMPPDGVATRPFVHGGKTVQLVSFF